MVDGAPLAGTFLPTENATDPNSQIGEVQCCKTDESDCTRRDPWDSRSNDDCISGNHDFVKYNYFEAESLCQNLEPKGDWDLCPKELIESTNPDICVGRGCGIWNDLTWTKKIHRSKEFSHACDHFLTLKTIFSKKKNKGSPLCFFTSFLISEFYKGNPLGKNGLKREKTHFFVFFDFTVPHEVKIFFFIFPGSKKIFLNT